MGEGSKIEWCHHTFNPWIGCTKVSQACKNCYAAVETYPRVQRARGRELWGADADRHITSVANWRQPLAWNREAAALGERRRVFCASLADVFEDRRDLDEPRAWLWELIDSTTALDWLLLTKRPENVRRMTRERWPHGLPFNVWLGVSVDDDGARRLDELMRISAVVRFASVEPLIAPCDLTEWLPFHAAVRAVAHHQRTGHMCSGGGIDAWCDDCRRGFGSEYAALSWVIVGGESGPHARPLDVQSVRVIRDDCKAAGVPLFMKQLGANVRDRNDIGFEGEPGDAWALGPRAGIEHDPDSTRNAYQGAPVRVRLVHRKGGDIAEWPDELRVREFPEVRP